MGKLLSSEKRKEIESVIYKTYDAADHTGTNSEYYKKIFKDMTDDQFYKFLERRLPFRFHTELFEVEPTMADIFDAFDVINKPLLEKIKMPFKYVNKNGNPIESEECLVIYINPKRMKQMLAKKNSIGLNIGKRDMRNGRLLDEDKGGQTSDREFESMSVFGWENTIDEYSTLKADAMDMKTEGYNIITTVGQLSMKDMQRKPEDSVAKNYFNVYLIGANLHSNLVDEDFITPHTRNARKRQIERDG